MLVPAIMMGIWYLFSRMLGIQDIIIRTIAIWSLIFALTSGAATADALRKRQAK